MMPLVLNFPSVNLVMIGASLTQLMSILSRLRRFLCLSILIAVSGIAQSETVSGGWSNTIDVINSYSAENALTYDALVQELAFQASEITGLSVPLVLPRVVHADSETVSRYACSSKCRALAAYHPHHGIVLDHSIDPFSNHLARSILLHEIVHYLQDKNKFYAHSSDCARWFKREEHAYAAQNNFLKKVHSTTRVSMSLSKSCRTNNG